MFKDCLHVFAHDDARLATQPVKNQWSVTEPMVTVRRPRSSQPVQLVKCQVRIATYNLQTCAVGVAGQLELALLAGQLRDLGVGLCGLQELRWPGEGECSIHVDGGDWSMLWSGGDVGRQHGVGLLISPI